MAPNAASVGRNGNSDEAEVSDGRYAVDIRVFLATITLSMAVSFIVGVTLGEAPARASLPLPLRANGGPMRVRDYLNIDEETQRLAEQHLPAGQHLLVDIEGVEGDFLNSEKRLTDAMERTVQQAGLTMLSYHCHSLMPSGVSCVGVLLESHISFHTWPDNGVITLDLFTCGSNPLLPAVAVIEELFGIGDSARAQWSHELRGFRSDEETKNHYLDGNSDLSVWVLSPLELHSKEQIYSNMTSHQRVDIWDVLEITDTPSYDDVKKHNMSVGDPRLNTPEFATPDRLLFLDGTLQSIYSLENVYHEAMVHPAMFAHPKPERVAVVGGGEGATLREVLKHKTLKEATMIELDEELVKITRELMPKMSDCSNLVDRASNCFDDSLTDLQYADGRAWFIDRFGEKPKVEAPEKFDVILVDALDPEEDTEIAEQLYNDQSFIDSLMNSLSDEGVLAIQVGTAATIDDPRADVGIYRNRELLFNLLEANEHTEAMLVYEEAHCGFLEPHSFLVVCKSANCRSRWYGRADQIDFEIYDRIVRTHNKERALTYFDGTTQRSYQWPKKGWETVYCRREPTPFECAYRTLPFDAELHDIDLTDEEESSFRVEVVKEGENIVSTKIFAKVDIPKGSFIMPEHLSSSLMVTQRNLEGLKENIDVGVGRVAVIEDLLEFFKQYSHESTSPGSQQNYVEVGGSVLIRRSSDDSETNVVKWLPPHPRGERPKYSPVYERNRVSFDVFVVAAQDIPKGAEIVMPEDIW